MSLSPGTRVGPYEVTALIGEGGMGKVWRAHHTALNRDDALKVLPDAFASDPDRLARFRREAQVLASLNHPNIAHVYGLEQADGVQALVMELVEGETLADRIARGPIPIDEALPIAKQIAEALEAAHEQGIIHRDLKPANIKVRADGTVKVLDFGLAKLTESIGNGQTVDGASLSPTITSPALMSGVGVLLGTAAYMSPEQAKGKPADKRSDIWAFGCVLFEMLTGRRAFEGDDVTDTIAAVIRAEPHWEALPPATPASIRRLLRRALRKNREERLPDIGSARLEIEDAALVSPEIMRAEPRPFWHSAQIAWSVAVILAVLLVGRFTLTMRRPLTEQSIIRATLLPPPNVRFTGSSNDRLLALSPDGRRLVFSASDADGGRHLWLRRLDSLDAQQLKGTDDAQAPFWSPDGKWIAFFDRSGLKKVSLDGGPPITLSTVSAGTTGGGGTWNANGTILFSDTGNLLTVPASGGRSSMLLPTSSGVPFQWPYFLPDGKHFLYRGNEFKTYVGSLDAPRGTLVGAGGNAQYAAGHLLFQRDGTLVAQPFDTMTFQLTGEPVAVASVSGNTANYGMAFSVSPSGVLVYKPGDVAGTRLQWFDRSGRPGVATDTADYANFALASDERHVAVSLTTGDPPNRDIWVVDLMRGVRSRITFDPGPDAVPAWSPDGSRIAFGGVAGSGAGGLIIKNANGSGSDEPVFRFNGGGGALDWSRDGRFILLWVQSSRTGSDLWVLPIASDRKPFPFLDTQFNEDHGSFSPDVKWIAYTSNESGAQQVYVQPFPPNGDKYVISRDGGSQPVWRNDGKELFYLTPESALMAVPVDTNHGFEVGAPQRLLVTGINNPDTTRRQYAVSRDGMRFLIRVSAESGELPLNVISNWTAALRK